MNIKNKVKTAELKLHIVESSTPLLNSRRRTPPTEPTSDFGVALKAHFLASGLSQQNFADLLSAALGRPVSQVCLSNWLKGVTPRSNSTNPNYADQVLEAAKAIAKTELKTAIPKYVDADEVKTQFAQWSQDGLSASQIQLAAGISASLYQIWRKGASPVRTSRWNTVRAKVELWKEFLASKGEPGKKKPAPPTRAAMPTRK